MTRPRCRGCKAYLRSTNPGPLCGPCEHAIAQAQIAKARAEEERRQARKRTIERMAAKAAIRPAGDVIGICRCGCG